MAMREYEFYLQVPKVFLTCSLCSIMRDTFSTRRSNSYPQVAMLCSVYFIYTDEISKEPAACLSGKLSCNWLIMLVTMATPISSHVKDKNSIFTALNEDMILQ